MYPTELFKHLGHDGNYSSKTAVLAGLRNANIFDDPMLFTLIDPANNFANYRKLYRETPGIAYLIPHLESKHKLSKTLEPGGYSQILWESLCRMLLSLISRNASKIPRRQRYLLAQGDNQRPLTSAGRSFLSWRVKIIPLEGLQIPVGT